MDNLENSWATNQLKKYLNSISWRPSMYSRANQKEPEGSNKDNNIFALEGFGQGDA